MKSPQFGYCLNGILRLLVGGAFVIAGALKIVDPAKFALDVSNYRLVPHELINLVAILLPWIEITAGSFVLVGIRLRAAALVITTLTVIFFTLIVSALARGLNIECGCFGTVGGKHIGLVNLAIDSTLLCLAALLVRRSKDGPANEIIRDAGARNSTPPPRRGLTDGQGCHRAGGTVARVRELAGRQGGNGIEAGRHAGRDGTFLAGGAES